MRECMNALRGLKGQILQAVNRDRLYTKLPNGSDLQGGAQSPLQRVNGPFFSWRWGCPENRGNTMGVGYWELAVTGWKGKKIVLCKGHETVALEVTEIKTFSH